MRSSLSEEEGAEMSSGLTTAPFPVPMHCWAGGNTENQEVEPNRKREGLGESVSRSGFISHYHTLLWLVIN